MRRVAMIFTAQRIKGPLVLLLLAQHRFNPGHGMNMNEPTPRAEPKLWQEIITTHIPYPMRLLLVTVYLGSQ